MDDDPLLMIPGPVPVAEEVQAAMDGQIIHPRGEQFQSLYADCQRALRPMFGTDTDPIFVNATGWAAIEAAIANCADPDDHLVCLDNGRFGSGMVDIAEGYVDTVEPVEFGSATAYDLDRVESALRDGADVITMVHAETSGGMLNPLAAVGELAAEHDALLIADCVTSVAGEELAVDDWGVDVAATSSQKCLGAPPGLSIMTLSEHARERLDPSNAPQYFDLARHIDYAERNQTVSTASIPLFRGLREAVRLILEEGLQARIDRTARLSAALRTAGDAMGLELCAAPVGPGKFTNAVTVFELPDDVADQTVVDGMAERGIQIRGGLGELSGETIRISTMGGNISESDLLTTINALQSTLAGIGVDIEDDGVAAAKAHLAESAP
ncbi:MAG: alanine--glyoxylate aminotransferase family protein [Halobacteriales archaeon]|nr:alanine--glyoxylate aminotransferase family protein [Halobacteriales archaeon]